MASQELKSPTSAYPLFPLPQMQTFFYRRLVAPYSGNGVSWLIRQIPHPRKEETALHSLEDFFFGIVLIAWDLLIWQKSAPRENGETISR